MSELVVTTGKKLGSTQKFNQNGTRIPVSLIAVVSTAGFKPGDLLKISGTSKGKGFAGVVKRHGFHGGPHTHGQSDRERHAGSIGQTTTPGRVYRGKRMAGRMGGDKVTLKGLALMDIAEKEKIMTVKGLIPGPINGKITLTKYAEMKKFVPLMSDGKYAEIVPDEEKIAQQAEQVAAMEKKAEEVKTETDKTVELKEEKAEGENNA